MRGERWKARKRPQKKKKCMPNFFSAVANPQIHFRPLLPLFLGAPIKASFFCAELL